jgi:tight adherence protein C
METIVDLIRSWIANPQSQQLAFIALAAGTIFIFVLGLSYVFLGATDPIRRRIGMTAADDSEDESAGKRFLVTIQTLMGPVSHWATPQSEIERSRTTQRLTYAGFRSPSALQSYYGIRVMLAIALPVLVLFTMQWFPEVASSEIMFGALVATAVGFLGPSMVLDRLVQRRIKKLRDGFPDALDLLVVCVESGLGLSAAIQRVSDEIGVSHEELGMELALVNAEIRAGIDRARALRNLADRTGLDDVRGLVSLLIQTMRFGTSVADTLRVYSEEFRDRRMQKAEEEAAKISTKLIFPLVFCLFPSFFTVAIGPAVIRLINVFSQMGID